MVFFFFFLSNVCFQLSVLKCNIVSARPADQILLVQRKSALKTLPRNGWKLITVFDLTASNRKRIRFRSWVDLKRKIGRQTNTRTKLINYWLADIVRCVYDCSCFSCKKTVRMTIPDSRVILVLTANNSAPTSELV